MPGFDRSGPMGRGPRSGGGLGYCGPGAGRGGRPWGGGRGRAFGGGRGLGYGRAGAGPFYADPGAEADELRAAADALKVELNDIETRLADMEKPE